MVTIEMQAVKTRLRIRSMVVLAAVSASMVFTVGSAGAASFTLIDLAGPFGGAEICVDNPPACIQQNGIRDLKVVLNVPDALPTPIVEIQPDPACMAPVNLQITVSSPALTGQLGVTVSFQQADEEGNPTGPPTVIPITVPVNLPGKSQPISLCLGPDSIPELDLGLITIDSLALLNGTNLLNNNNAGWIANILSNRNTNELHQRSDENDLITCVVGHAFAGEGCGV